MAWIWNVTTGTRVKAWSLARRYWNRVRPGGRFLGHWGPPFVSLGQALNLFFLSKEGEGEGAGGRGETGPNVYIYIYMNK
jgi:hypothetical protein